jgi:hypothetical protein
MKVYPLVFYSKKEINDTEDLIYNYQTIWPIYSLTVKDKNGLWFKFSNVLDSLELQNLTVKHLNKFYDQNPDIEFEIYYFNKSLPEIYSFKYKNKIYCYTTNKFKKQDDYIDVRFYFDLKKILKINLS